MDPQKSLYHWEKWQPGLSPLPELAVYADSYCIVARGQFENNWYIARFELATSKCSFQTDKSLSKEVDIFELLVSDPDAVVEWITCFRGDIPSGCVGPIGSQNFYIGRAKGVTEDKTYKLGFIDPTKGHMTGLFATLVPPFTNYEALVIRDPLDLKASECATPYSWYEWEGMLYDDAVYVCDRYVVGRIEVPKEDDNRVGQFDIKKKRLCYVNSTAIAMQCVDGAKLLVKGQKAVVEWKAFKCEDPVPDNALRLFVNCYVGRVPNANAEEPYLVCNVLTGTVKDCIFYQDGKVEKLKECEILIIRNGPKS